MTTTTTTSFTTDVGTYEVTYSPVVEGAVARVTVKRTAGTTNEVIRLETALGTGAGAASSTDFTAKSENFNLNLNSTGLFNIQTTADSLVEGTEFFLIRFYDGTGAAKELKISIEQQILEPNAAPDAVNDVVTTAEDTPIIISVLANDTDADGDSLTVTGVTEQPGHGTAMLNPNGTITYTPSANYHGADSFTYRISDGKGGFDTATVSLTVTSVNDAPTGSATAPLAGGTEDVAYTVSAADLLEGFSDVDGDTLSVDKLTASHGTVTQNANGTFTIQPTANYNGPVSLNYDVIDGNGGKVAATQSFTLAAVNDAPTAVADPFGTGLVKIYEQSEFLIDVSELLSNDFDVDGDTFTFTGIGSAPGKGSASVVTEGASTYIAYTYTGAALAENATTTDKLFYVVTDSHGASSSGEINLTVTGLANKMILGTNGIDTTRTTGSNTANDTIDGLNGDDVVSGLGGNDKLFGSNGADQLFGGDGADYLDGGRGDDLLNGGRGNDIMAGGLGADTFDFTLTGTGSSNSGVDTITDFKVGTDDIVLGTGVIITGISKGHYDADAQLDTTLALNNGGAIKVLGIGELGLDDWALIA